MQGGVGESGVELAEARRLLVEVERLGVGHEGVDAASPRRFDHRLRSVEADHPGARIHDLAGQDSVAAAEVEDQLARLRREQLERRRAERRNEGGVAGIVARRPLGGGIEASLARP